MNVYVYWDRRDLDCKKIYHCMSPNDDASIIEEMKKNNTLCIERITGGYKDITYIEDKIKSNDIIIFCTHGTPDEILRYRGREDENDTLISEENLHVLDGKIVMAFCCASASILGKKSVSAPFSCVSYIGFNEDVLYDDGNVSDFRHIIYEAYKAAFSKSIIYALKNQCTVHMFRIYLTQMLRRASVEAVLKSNNLHVETIFAGAITGVASYGENERVVFS